MSQIFPNIQAAAIDGRLHTIYLRQEQLERLHKSLISNVSDINAAIGSDYGHPSSEIATELHLTLKAVKDYYSLLNPRKAHENENLIANGKDSPENRVPVGVVYIEPTVHALFYSTMVPLAAAIAAGNCVVALLEKNLRAVSNVLHKLLPQALDADIFAIASSPVEDQAFLSKCFCVLQNGSESPASSRRLVLYPSSLTVAIVDRTADARIAARELVAAKQNFKGRSPYAPDLVLVNEFTKKALLEAIVSECESPSSADEKEKLDDSVKSCFAKFQKYDPTGRTIHQQPHFAIVDLSTRANILQQTKLPAPLLVIHSIKSLDDAIDLIGSKISHPSACLAAYHFSNLPTAKYLAQFIPAESTFINHIPRDLLVGPKFPMEMFSIPRPAFVHPSAESLALTRSGEVEELLLKSAAPLKEMKRHPGGGVGFFEQGFLINAGLILASTLTVSATGLLWLWKWSRAM